MSQEDDIRLDAQVRHLAQANNDYVLQKNKDLIGAVHQFLETHFKDQYDETFAIALYCRKGNDVNTIGSCVGITGGIFTDTDRSLMHTKFNRLMTIQQ